MGLGRAFIADLTELKRAGALEGDRVVEIGAQQLADSFLEANDLLASVYEAFGHTRQHLGEPSGSFAMSAAAPSSRDFWRSLGFTYAAIDFDGHRDSTALDLNRDAVPAEMQGAFSLVVNTGTTEHVANQGHAFRVIHDLAAKGAVMYHELPVFQLDHGLLNYNPRFFWRLREYNDYELLTMKVCSWGEFPVPEHILADNLKFGGGEQTMTQPTLPNVTIRVALRKRDRRPYVTPLDLPEELVPMRNRRTFTLMRRLAFWN